jgi:KDO2-lipid IV(A) lauroyltransferase
MPVPETRRDYFAHDGLFWRRMASMGAQHLPTWWVRYSPPVFGVAAAVALPHARRAVRNNLRRIRGPRPFYRDVIDTTQTFAAYAGCLAETLAVGSKNHAAPTVDIIGGHHLHDAVSESRGVLLLTMHTGGWEAAGPLLAEHTKLDVALVMEEERVAGARALHDRAREVAGVRVIHIGPDPLAALPLVRHVSERKGAAAMQIDRVPASGRAVQVRLLDRPAVLPEGPFRLAQLTGAPLVTVFCRRRGFRRYAFEAHRARSLPRRPTPEQLASVTQSVADDMTQFLRAYPTQWFEWGNGTPREPVRW